MTMPGTHSYLSSQPTTFTAETPMPFAPTVTLDNGHSFIPQHYLSYRQSEVTVRRVLEDIHFNETTLLFAATDNAGLYVQVGMIGRENYDHSSSVRPHKLVYGRKWRIDTDTPTSEVVQTAMLAIKKACEHEVRELLTLREPITGKISAPLSNHHDLPLMANNADRVAVQAPVLLNNIDAIQRALEGMRFAQRKLQVLSAEHRRNGQWWVDLRIAKPPLARHLENDLREFSDLEFTVVLSHPTQAELIYTIMDALIQHSDRHVEETFTYRGFHRFSRRNDPLRIAALSIASRPYVRDARNARFMSVFRASNYEVDASRAPALGSGNLAEINRQKIAAFPDLLGHMPSGMEEHQQRRA